MKCSDGFIISATLTLLWGAAAQASTQHWVTAGDGFYNDIANWTSAVPGVNEDIIFDQNLAYTVTFPTGFNWRIRTIRVLQGDVTLDLSDSLYTVWSDSTFGTPQGVDDLQIAANPGEVASLTVTGGRMRLRFNYQGAATFLMGSGAGSVGTLTVTGPNTEFNVEYPPYSGIGVGGGEANINVLNGARVTGLNRLAVDADSTASLWVDGAGSQASLSTLGALGTAFLTVSNGGTITTASSIGNAELSTPGGIGIADVGGSGSRLGQRTNYGVTVYGRRTGSSLYLHDGAALLGGQLILADESAGAGATVTVASNATVDVTDVKVGSKGVLTMGGASFRAWQEALDPYTAEPIRQGLFEVCYGGTFNLTAGRLEADVIDTTGTCGYASQGLGSFNMTGGELSAVTYNGDLNLQAGVLDVGDSPGTMSVTGNYTQGAVAAMRIELDGAFPGVQRDTLAVTGTAALDGRLEIELNPAFAVSAGDSFDFLTADAISGTFATIGNRCISDTLRWELAYHLDPGGPDTVTLNAVAVPAQEVCVGPATVVGVDVDPWSAANEVRPDSTDTIFVAILGSNTASGDASDFDVQQVDPDTLALGVNYAPNIAVNPLYGDYDGDSNQDAAFGFRTQDTGISCDDTEVTLYGQTFLGEPFEGVSPITPTECTAGCHP